jgi:hypothetical protein
VGLLSDTESLADRRDGGVRGAEGEVGVGLDEIGHPGEVAGYEVDAGERAVDE